MEIFLMRLSSIPLINRRYRRDNKFQQQKWLLDFCPGLSGTDSNFIQDVCQIVSLVPSRVLSKSYFNPGAITMADIEEARIDETYARLKA